MGVSKKSQEGSGLESDSKKWVIAGIGVRSIKTKPKVKKDRDSAESDARSTTPTGKEARISARMACPPAPKKKRPILRCNIGAREFFTPPDLETVFKRHVEETD